MIRWILMAGLVAMFVAGTASAEHHEGGEMEPVEAAPADTPGAESEATEGEEVEEVEVEEVEVEPEL